MCNTFNVVFLVRLLVAWHNRRSIVLQTLIQNASIHSSHFVISSKLSYLIRKHEQNTGPNAQIFYPKRIQSMRHLPSSFTITNKWQELRLITCCRPKPKPWCLAHRSYKQSHANIPQPKSCPCPTPIALPMMNCCPWPTVACFFWRIWFLCAHVTAYI